MFCVGMCELISFFFVFLCVFHFRYVCNSNYNHQLTLNRQRFSFILMRVTL